MAGRPVAYGSRESLREYIGKAIFLRSEHLSEPINFFRAFLNRLAYFVCIACQQRQITKGRGTIFGRNNKNMHQASLSQGLTWLEGTG